MKRILLALCMTMSSLAMMAQAPAFPGAEGFARYTTTGGRGGKVYHVTTLADNSLEGSLRYGLERMDMKRIIVFDVSGVIELTKKLQVKYGNVTIEGQTAPGDGICLKNYTLNIDASNVIVRYIRCRMGDEKLTEDDAMNSFFHDGDEKQNIIIDHCSLSWSTDECGSFYGIKNFTLQWCILSEGLRNSVHGKGSHGYGGIWGGQNALYHHNLLSSHDSRNPRFDHDYVNSLKGPLDYINNVVYNWGSNSTYGGEGANTTNTYKMYNMINNYYKPGPATKSGVKTRFVNPTTKCTNCTAAKGVSTVVPGHFYITGNVMEGNSTVTSDNWNGVYPDDASRKAEIKSSIRFLASDGTADVMTMHSATEAFNKVLSYAGASYKRDVVDVRITDDARRGDYTYEGSNGSTGGLIDTQSDAGGWPTYVSKTKLTDTDNDGMPDVWETANGLNPNSASDAYTYTLDSKGYYTNIEVYCNSLVEDLVKAQNANSSTPVVEYYPSVNKASGVPYYDGSVAEGVLTHEGNKKDDGGGEGGNTDLSYTISQSTYTTSSGTNWSFKDGFGVTNSNSKDYTTGNEKGIKYSARVKYTITMPSGFSVSEAVFSGYDNYADTDAYISEVNGQGYSETKYVFPKKDSEGKYTVVTHNVSISPAAKNSMTFTVSGQQTVLSITLKGTSTTGVENIVVDENVKIARTEYFTIHGQSTSAPSKGIFIVRKTLENGVVLSSKVLMQ